MEFEYLNIMVLIW